MVDLKDHSKTLVALVISREHIFEVHLIHSFIVNMQPNVPNATFYVRVKHVDCIMSSAVQR